MYTKAGQSPHSRTKIASSRTIQFTKTTIRLVCLLYVAEEWVWLGFAFQKTGREKIVNKRQVEKFYSIIFYEKNRLE